MPDVRPADGLAIAVAAESRPLLRGWLHLVSFFVAVPVAVWVIVGAPTPRAQASAAVYAFGLVALFGVSGSYHRGRWGPTWRRRMQSLDHATIFVMIAGSYTPLCVLVLRGWLGATLLAVAWAGAAVGAVLAWQGGRRCMIARSTLYIALGWAMIAAGPRLVERLDPAQLVLIAAGGVLFTAGAITLGTRWPNPFPKVFGYHEVWHAMVVVAVICHLVAIQAVIHATPTV